jgi:hypothetical protein
MAIQEEFARQAIELARQARLAGNHHSEHFSSSTAKSP